MTRNRKIAALLTLPLLFILAGCFRLDLDVNLISDTEAEVGMEFVDSMDFLGDELDCDEMGLTDGLDGVDAQDLTTEEFEEDGHKGCRVTGTVNPQELEDSGLSVVKEGDTLLFTKPADAGDDEMLDFDDEMFDMFAPEVSISVTFPGPVTSANEDGVIEGNTVTWTGVQALGKELTASGPAGKGKSDSSSLFGSSNSAPPMALIVGLAAALVVVIVGIVLVLARRNSGSSVS